MKVLLVKRIPGGAEFVRDHLHVGRIIRMKEVNKLISVDMYRVERSSMLVGEVLATNCLYSINCLLRRHRFKVSI